MLITYIIYLNIFLDKLRLMCVPGALHEFHGTKVILKLQNVFLCITTPVWNAQNCVNKWLISLNFTHALNFFSIIKMTYYNQGSF